MQSRISFFDKTVFRKNLTRFAPVWGLYTLCLFMGLFLMLDNGTEYWLGSQMAECVQVMGVITPCYALLVAMLLYGDLYNARMCNALHALPLRRETWHFTNIASGLVFHLVPTAAMASVATVIMALGGFPDSWVTGVYWFLGTNLQFLGFFGMAVVSAYCVGSRFAMAVVYAILNWGAVILCWLVDELYMPMFYGLQMDYSGASLFSPVYRILEDPFFSARRINYEFYNTAKEAKVQIGACWWYYFGFAAVGILMLLGAVQIYRKRHLEAAGDFMAIKGLNPVFHVVYSIMVGAVFSFIVSEMFGYSNGMLFLFLGLAVGYFTGRMLLERNIQVFQLRQWMRCGVLMGVVGLSLVIASLDPFGAVRRIPETEEIVSVYLATGHYSNHESEITLTDPADIQQVLALHQNALERWEAEEAGIGGIEPTEVAVTADTVEAVKTEPTRRVEITIQYELQGGEVVSRYYDYWSYQPEFTVLQRYFSSPECVFGREVTAQELLEMFPVVRMSPNYGDTQTYTDPEDLLKLYEAMLLDCEAGTMANGWDFHYSYDADMVCWLELGNEMEKNLFSDAEHTVAWLKDHGYDWEEIKEEYKLG